MVQVREHERGGTKVRAHSRWHPGARRELTIFAVVALVVVGFGSSSGGSAGGAGSGERLPRPQRTGVYPVHFPGWDKPAPRPAPTVSYPIRWDRSQ